MLLNVLNNVVCVNVWINVIRLSMGGKKEWRQHVQCLLCYWGMSLLLIRPQRLDAGRHWSWETFNSVCESGKQSSGSTPMYSNMGQVLGHLHFWVNQVPSSIFSHRGRNTHSLIHEYMWRERKGWKTVGLSLSLFSPFMCWWSEA